MVEVVPKKPVNNSAVKPRKKPIPTRIGKTPKGKDKKISNAKNIPQTKTNIIKAPVYHKADRFSLRGFLNSVPEEFIPTKKTAEVLGIIFLIVVIWAIVQFPLGTILAGETNIDINVGVPMTFFKFSVADPKALPLKFGGLIVDLIIYILIAYIIEVIINYSLKKSRKIWDEKEKAKHPVIYKDAKTVGPSNTVADKITKKVFKKNIQNNI